MKERRNENGHDVAHHRRKNGNHAQILGDMQIGAADLDTSRWNDLVMERVLVQHVVLIERRVLLQTRHKSVLFLQIIGVLRRIFQKLTLSKHANVARLIWLSHVSLRIPLD